MWNVATDIGNYKLYATDPQSDAGRLPRHRSRKRQACALALRLKVENRKISEIETLVYRAGVGPPARGLLPRRHRRRR